MRLLEKKELNLTPLFLMGNAIILSLVFLIELINLFGLGRIANSKAPTLVELSDGESVRVSPLDGEERSAQAITHFVGQTMTGLLTWNAVPQNVNESPVEKLKLDTGVQAGSHKITTKTWATGFALSEDFRTPFLEQIAKLTPSDVFQGSSQSILKVTLLGEPKKLNQRRGWTVDLISELIVFKGGNVLGEPITFNKTIFVRAIDTPPLPKNYSDLQKTVYQARKAGLEIYKIQDFDLGKK